MMAVPNSAEVAPRKRARLGFTLLEIILTLSMSVVLMLLIGGAIQFYGRDMNVSDMDARQTQLAAAVMQMIEDDLRASLHPEPLDTSGLEALFSSLGEQSGGGQGGAAAGGEEDLSGAGIDSVDADMGTTELAAPVDLTTGSAVLAEPGLIGNQYQIQIDVSRLPRLEEYAALFDALVTNIDDIPSDLKTVTYYVQPAGTTGGVVDPLAEVGSDADEFAGGGLVRRSLDRAATSYASLNGSISSLNQTGELLAPEVTAVEFQYWDGITWQIEWSSDEYGELPLAIQVTLSMIDPVAATAASPLSPDEATRTFQHIIRLPMAIPIEEEMEEDTAAETGI